MPDVADLRCRAVCARQALGVGDIDRAATLISELVGVLEAALQRDAAIALAEERLRTAGWQFVNDDEQKLPWLDEAIYDLEAHPTIRHALTREDLRTIASDAWPQVLAISRQALEEIRSRRRESI